VGRVADLTAEIFLAAIFDPRTSAVLAKAEVVFAPSTDEYGVPPDTVFRETAYLRPEIIDSAE
jgi:hypothetical protein